MCASVTLYEAVPCGFLDINLDLLYLLQSNPSDSFMVFFFSPLPPPHPPHQAADESSEEASFYEILPCCARFRCGELIAEGQWHHLVLVMSKGMLKNSMATLYIDGQLINTVKVML